MSGEGHPGSGHYLDRKTGELQSEAIFGDRALRFAYETALGRSLWNILFSTAVYLPGSWDGSTISSIPGKPLSDWPALPVAALGRRRNIYESTILLMIFLPED